MVSPTSQTRNIRQSKHRKMGRKRKNALANHGSTRSQEELFGSKEALAPETQKSA
jgi:hypothetical protein